MFWKSEKFRRLQEYWYKKLAENGFEDAERKGLLIQNAPNSYRQETPTKREQKLEYFLLLGQGVSEERFECEIDKKVMTMIADGISLVEIAKKCKMDRNTLRYICRRYEHKWGIKSWTLKQRGLGKDKRTLQATRSSRTKLIKYR